MDGYDGFRSHKKRDKRSIHMSYSEGSRAWVDDGRDGVLDSLQEGLTVAAAWMMHRKRLEGFAGGQRRRSRQQRRRVTIGGRGERQERWINGKVSENRDEWMEEVKTHCEGCHDNKDESSQVQEERIQEQRRREIVVRRAKGRS